MRADEYDAADRGPDGLPVQRLAAARVGRRQRRSASRRRIRNNLSFLKGGMAMLSYFNAFGRAGGAAAQGVGHGLGHLRDPQGPVRHPRRQAPRLHRAEHGHVPTAQEGAGRLRGPDAAPAARGPLRGRPGEERARSASGCTAAACRFVSPGTVREVLLADAQADHRGILWPSGHQTLFYAEGNWNPHLKYIRRAARPEHRLPRGPGRHLRGAPGRWGTSSASAAAFPTTCLAFGTPEEVRACCKKVIDGVARDGGYIMDASAIMQDDTRAENLRAMTEVTREYGVY